MSTNFGLVLTKTLFFNLCSTNDTFVKPAIHLRNVVKRISTVTAVFNEPTSSNGNHPKGPFGNFLFTHLAMAFYNAHENCKSSSYALANCILNAEIYLKNKKKKGI